jgi:thiol:disulfide interchange protein DsbA
MTCVRNLLIVVAIISFTACGGGSETGQVGTDQVADNIEPSAATETEALDESPDAAGVAVLEVVEESAGEESPEQIEDDTIVLAEAESAAEVEAEKAWKFSQGKHFTMLTTAQGTSSPADVIEVTEVFWYGCPHCFNFDPFLKKWEKDLPDNVNFVRLPVMWNPTNEIHARMFYTAEALGKLDEMHEAIFREMHINNQSLTTEASIEALFLNFGVSEEEFEDTFRSFAIESKLKRAKNLTQRYRIQSVPILVTNGKYLATGPDVKNFDDMLAVTDELIEREQQEL